MHAYYEETDNLADFLASAVDMDGFIEDVIAAADYVRAKIRSPKQLKHLLRRVERLVPDALQPAAPARLGTRAGAHRGRLQRGRRRRRRLVPHLAAEPRRPRRRRLPGAAGQHHRADPHRAAAGRPGGSRSSTRSPTWPGWPAASRCACRSSPRGGHAEVRVRSGRHRRSDLGRGDRALSRSSWSTAASTTTRPSRRPPRAAAAAIDRTPGLPTPTSARPTPRPRPTGSGRESRRRPGSTAAGSPSRCPPPPGPPSPFPAAHPDPAPSTHDPRRTMDRLERRYFPARLPWRYRRPRRGGRTRCVRRQEQARRRRRPARTPAARRTTAPR